MSLSSPRIQIRTAWLWGLFLSTVLFLLLFFTAGFSYVGTDDIPILRSFMGYEGGVPASFHLYIHTALAWILHGLAKLFPGVAWFSFLQIFLLWLCSVVILKNLIQGILRRNLPLWFGLALGIAYLFIFPLFILCRISYTTTSALLGATAVFQLINVDFSNGSTGQILKGTGFSVFLLICCYSLRQIGVLPALAFWLLGILLIYILHFSPLSSKGKRPSLKPFLLSLLICALSFGIFAGVRALEIRVLKQEDFLQWQNARIRLFDYTDFSQTTDAETLAKIGWTEAEFRLVANGWFFMDQNITAEAFDILYEKHEQIAGTSPSAKIAEIPRTLQNFLANNTYQALGCWLILSLSLLIAVFTWLQGKERRWIAAAALGIPLLGLLLLSYLAYYGRLPMRAAVTVLFPAAAFLFSLVPMALPASRKALPLVLSALFLFAACTIGYHGYPFPNPNLTEDMQLRQELCPIDLDTFALENPDMLIIYDLSLISSQPMFPDTSQGIPANLMFWGGWPSYSPSWLYQLSQYGIDGKSMSPADFLRENVLIASTDGAPWDSLFLYLDENIEGDVDWDFYSELGYIGFFQFFEF